MHFSPRSKQESLLFLWFTTSWWEWLKQPLIACKHFSSVHSEAALLTVKLWWPRAIPNQNWLLLAVARIPNFPYVNHPGHDEICAGLTLECIASFHTLCTSKILGMHKSGKSNEKSWTDWRRDHTQQLGRRLDACRRADTECSHIHCWWEMTRFLWSTATYVVEVISFFTSLLGCFTIKAP